MYWLSPTRYVRHVAAAAVLAVGVASEFWPSPTTAHPFATEPIAAGEPVAGSIEWRRIPAGILPSVDIDGASTTADLQEGEPLLPATVSRHPIAPADWWSIPVPMAFTAPTGAAVMLVDTADGTTTDGVIVTPPSNDPFAVQSAALVAVPAESAARFAVAAADGRVTVLVHG